MNVDVSMDHRSQEVQWRDLGDLLLDSHNPRFGGQQKGAGQRELLNLVVEKFGIEDVLSSIAVNGYFPAEPLLCISGEDGKLVVKEGNRRLCACIILAGDARAIDQRKRVDLAKSLWERSGRQKFLPVPVIEYSESDGDFSQLQSYLGVRHLTGAQPWDAYAKTVWIVNAIDSQKFTVSQISDMAGDRYKTVLRLLESYRFVNQLIEKSLFDPEDSTRSGRGTVVEYPFSWIYTILGYTAAREFVGLEDYSEAPRPIPEEKLENAQTVVVAMFGSKSRERRSVIDESSQFLTLANALSDPEKVTQIRSGASLDDIELSCRPIKRKLEDNLDESRRLLSDLAVGLTESPPCSCVADQHVPLAARVHRLSARVSDNLQNLAYGGHDAG